MDYEHESKRLSALILNQIKVKHIVFIKSYFSNAVFIVVMICHIFIHQVSSLKNRATKLLATNAQFAFKFAPVIARPKSHVISERDVSEVSECLYLPSDLPPQLSV